MSVYETIADYANALERMRIERDDLLAALRYLEQMATYTAAGKHNCPEIHGALAEARAAIAKVEGK